MSIYNNILVVANIDTEQQPALARAMKIGKKSKSPSKITFFLAIYDFSYEMTSMLSPDERNAMRAGVIHQREQWMKEIAAPYRDDEHIELDIKVVWHNRPYEAIIAEVFDKNYELVVKTTRQHDLLESVLFTPTDWHLLRKAPCAVLLVKNHNWPEKGHVVVSVHVGSEVEVHLDLNHRMVEQAIDISGRLDATLHLVNSYPMTPPNITVELPEFDPTIYTDSVRGHHLTEMKALRQQYSIPEELTVVEQGLPQDVIPKVAKEIGAGLVVVGTSGRTGLSAVFLGNTAENIIDHINCDVLALKPKGYISPLDPVNGN
ncbi:universal stress protein UspE [Vibrio sp. UCD-FRSSP16_10]|uniref:universal stress protein UspE n=1 Tax=unclassified Vibrio TaxID=2614977 RepID=UPI000800812A|nr:MULTISPECIES: universal stress protein UspE [unclassified Vibrio]OBT12180.1 universal stress protein UspE [Vibrio sp. UCD-FRSSP16_30]OBT20511.1 universal stress protein UspE [Vibrio sp. UCD-FRSSP16_10]